MKNLVLSGMACLVALAVGPSVAVAQEKSALAKQAHEILKANCYRCHGQDGTVEGGMNYILDVKTLVSRKKVIPGNRPSPSSFSESFWKKCRPKTKNNVPAKKTLPS